jgi:hypothetical protein
MHRFQTDTNGRKCLSANEKTNELRGRVVGPLPCPTSNGNPPTVGLRHLIHPATAAWMSRYHGIGVLGSLLLAFPFGVGRRAAANHADCG